MTRTAGLAERAATEVTAELKRQHRSIAWLSTQTGCDYMYLHRRLGTGQSTALDLDDIELIARALAVPVPQLLPDPVVA